MALVPASIGDEVERAARDLKSKDDDKVRAAVGALAKLGPEGVARLAGVLESDNFVLRTESLIALVKLGAGAESALAKLVARSQSIGASVDATMTHAMLGYGLIEGVVLGGGIPGMTSYGDRKSDADKREFERVVEARLCSVAIGRAGAQQIEALVDLVAPLDRGAAPNELTGPRMGVALALGAALEDAPDGTFAKLWPRFERALAAQSSTERLTALIALVGVGSNPKSAVAQSAKAVAARLESEDPTERAIAAAALTYLNAACDAVGAALESRLEDPSDYVRVFAASALRERCGDSPKAEDALIAALSSDDDETRIAAAESLWSLERDPSERAVGPLTKRLDSKNERVLTAVLKALAECGESAKGAAPKVKALTKHRSYEVSRAADRTLDRIR